MLASDLITELIPPLKTSDTVAKALTWMAEFKVSHLPIVNNAQLLGVITEDDIIELNQPQEPIGNQRLSLINPYVYEWQHMYEVIRLVSTQKLSIVPVLDEKNNYMGLISMNDLLTNIASMGSLENPGGILILEMGVRDYSLSEISRIVESDNASILSSYITSHTDSMRIEVTLKINKVDLTGIISAFERFNYVVKASYHEANFANDSMDRYDQLMRYLNI